MINIHVKCVCILMLIMSCFQQLNKALHSLIEDCLSELKNESSLNPSKVYLLICINDHMSSLPFFYFGKSNTVGYFTPVVAQDIVMALVSHWRSTVQQGGCFQWHLFFVCQHDTG